MDSLNQIEETIAQAHKQNTGFTATLASGQIVKACVGFILQKSSVIIFDKTTREEMDVLYTDITEVSPADNFADHPFDPGTVVPSGTESIGY